MSNMHETPVRTSQRTYFPSISKTKRLILYREVISHYPENPRKAHKCWELQSFFFYVTVGGICSYHRALNV